MNVQMSLWISGLTEGDITIKDEDAIEQVVITLGDTQLWFNTRDEVVVFHEKLGEYLNQPICELCDKPAVTIESDELGNDCHVCTDHAEALASKKPERAADTWHDEQKAYDEQKEL